MKKNISIFLAIILVVILQTSILPLCFSEKIIPDLVLVALVSWVSVFGFQYVWIWAIISGIVLDLFSFTAVGSNVFSFIFFSYCTSFFSKRLILGEKIGGILVGVFFISLATFFHNLWMQLISVGFKLQKIWEIKIFLLESASWKIIFNLILFFVFILIFKGIRNKFYPSNNLLLGK